MVVVNIETIHGDMLVKNMSQGISVGSSSRFPVNDILQRYPSAKSLGLKPLMGEAVYVVDTGGSQQLLDSTSGELLSPIKQKTAIEIASYHYAGSGNIGKVSLIESNPPGEIKFYPLPIWRIDFDDAWGTSFYVDPQTGRFMTRRHTLWRIFDFLWMLHIMDYDERENVNNTLLRVFSMSGVLLALSGLWLLFYSFNRKKITGELR